jgi:hypothetical protein
VKSIKWTEDGVLSMRLRPDLYTLAQMRQNNLVQFFDISSEDGDWADVDLSTVAPLFCIYVATRPLKALSVAVVAEDDVRPNRRPTPTAMIKYRFGGDGDHDADLIELTETYTSIGATVLQEGLTIEDDLDAIYGHELAGMFGDPEKLRTRLVRWFDTGVNWDESKVFVFKGIQPPPPGRSTDMRNGVVEEVQPPPPDRSATKAADLSTYGSTDYLRAVHPPLRRKLQPHVDELIAQLDGLPAGSPDAEVLRLLETCMESVNDHADEIQTVDREALLAAFYDIGALVGLDPESRFLERWRGDW